MEKAAEVSVQIQNDNEHSKIIPVVRQNLTNQYHN